MRPPEATPIRVAFFMFTATPDFRRWQLNKAKQDNQRQTEPPADWGAGEVPAVLTVIELARHLRIGRNQAYDLVRGGQVRSLRIGNRWRIPREAVQTYLSEGA
jgi:excisionase family DNA binding protein